MSGCIEQIAIIVETLDGSHTMARTYDSNVIHARKRVANIFQVASDTHLTLPSFVHYDAMNNNWLLLPSTRHGECVVGWIRW